MIPTWLNKLENTRPFSESEAWWLFRAVAFGESLGWSILLSGLAIRHYNLYGHAIAVQIAGQIHGILFLAYFGILIATSTSLKWSKKRLIVALVSGIPPFGSIFFEQWASHRRSKRKTLDHYYSIAWKILSNQSAYVLEPKV